MKLDGIYCANGRRAYDMISGSDGSVIFFAGHDRWCQSNHLWGFEHLLVAAFVLGLFRDRRAYWMTGVTMRRDSGKFLKM